MKIYEPAAAPISSSMGGSSDPYALLNKGSPTSYIRSITSNGATQNNTGLIQQAMAAFKAQQDAANKANEARYAEGKGLYDQANARLVGSNSAQLAAIEDKRLQGRADTVQSATSRGLGNTTIVDSLQRGVDSDAARLTMESNNALADRQAGIDIAKAGFIERRNDVAPDPNSIYALLRQLAANGGAGGAGGNVNVGFGMGAGVGGTIFR